ncbi:MAG: hypothetical protein FVQ80_12475 [Planctomycetes bacterium]|nr:hypothetical protein [Planctomycetota bacterium]
MKKGFVCLAALTAILILTVITDVYAVDTWEIDKVRSKGVLNSGDFEVIDEYISESVRELVETRDLTSTAKICTLILSRSVTNQESASAQYNEQFIESANKHIAAGFELTDELESQKRQLSANVNLLILIDGLKEPRLVDLAIAKLDDDSMVIRYWAVHAVTNAGITAKLNSSDDRLASEIAGKLLQLVDSSSNEILSLMAEFAAGINVRQGQQLLVKIADMRIKKYEYWDVDYERLDSVILKALCDKLASSRSTSDLAKSFAQLYSYTIQRYIKGRNVLTDQQKQKLASILTEIERVCISKILDKPQATIKRALEHKDINTLLLEHSRLFGDAARAGVLAEKLDFDYGINPDGSRRTEPLELPEPPISEAQ